MPHIKLCPFVSSLVGMYFSFVSKIIRLWLCNILMEELFFLKTRAVKHKKRILTLRETLEAFSRVAVRRNKTTITVVAIIPSSEAARSYFENAGYKSTATNKYSFCHYFCFSGKEVIVSVQMLLEEEEESSAKCPAFYIGEKAEKSFTELFHSFKNSRYEEHLSKEITLFTKYSCKTFYLKIIYFIKKFIYSLSRQRKISIYHFKMQDCGEREVVFYSEYSGSESSLSNDKIHIFMYGKHVDIEIWWVNMSESFELFNVKDEISGHMFSSAPLRDCFNACFSSYENSLLSFAP